MQKLTCNYVWLISDAVSYAHNQGSTFGKALSKEFPPVAPYHTADHTADGNPSQMENLPQNALLHTEVGLFPSRNCFTIQGDESDPHLLQQSPPCASRATCNMNFAFAFMPNTL